MNKSEPILSGDAMKPILEVLGVDLDPHFIESMTVTLNSGEFAKVKVLFSPAYFEREGAK